LAFPLLWVNGHRVEPTLPHLSPLDRGFTLADGLFETMRAYRGVIFRLDQHLERLAAGARALGITLPSWLAASVPEAMRIAHDAGSSEASVRLTVSRGIGGTGVIPPAPVPDDAGPTVVLAIQAVPAFPEAIYARGLAARIASGRRNERGLASGIKALAYTEAIMAMAEARAAGADEAIWLDTEEHVAEATSSNLFFLTEDTLVTPPVTCGVLPGITRRAVMELAPSLGLAVSERIVERAELFGAREAFLTSSLREIAPLVRVDGRAIGAGTVGPVTRRIMQGYAALTHRECAP
jgi:branched-chain amino acid aminotransferase